MKKSLLISEIILDYIDDGRFQTPTLKKFNDSLDVYIIESEKVFFELIPYFCSYKEVINRVSQEYNIFFKKFIKDFYYQIIYHSNLDSLKFMIENFHLDNIEYYIEDFLMISSYNYLNHDYKTKENLSIIEWCFNLCIKHNIVINCSNDNFIKLNLYKQDNLFYKEKQFIELKLNSANF